MIDMRESMTAKMCSFARAYHSNHARQKIYDDYLAYDMMGKEEYEEVGMILQNTFGISQPLQQKDFSGKLTYPMIDYYLTPILLSRIAYAETELMNFAKKHGKCQYVICGAGMDTFAFRNPNTDIRIFELDHPDTQRYKMEKIQKLEWIIPQNVQYVPIDFSKHDLVDTLKNAGFDPLIPTYFAILGVTYYLTLPVFEETIQKISTLSIPGNKIVFDYPDETTFGENPVERVYRLTQATESLGEQMKQGLYFEDVKEALDRHQFSVETHLNPERIQAVYFANRTDGQKAFENIHLILANKEA
ncbi:class I SAM-dependent methyltransferase [Anaerotignum sp.]|uniref:class I SAM-dependent methyltransferase n=1 Tax=Anaerotignum sp. TaxID=2039241 RepID=UPI0028976DEC|nr:class I SAM-dependent methyltransferase [Anaerotignum sp.]